MFCSYRKLINFIVRKDDRCKLSKILPSILTNKQIEALSNASLQGPIMPAVADAVGLSEAEILKKIATKLAYEYKDEIDYEKISLLHSIPTLNSVSPFVLLVASNEHKYTCYVNSPDNLVDMKDIGTRPEIIFTNNQEIQKAREYVNSSDLYKAYKILNWLQQLANSYAATCIELCQKNGNILYKFTAGSKVASGVINSVKWESLKLVNPILEQDKIDLIFSERPLRVIRKQQPVSRVLIIEDNASFAVILKKYLKKAGLVCDIIDSYQIAENKIRTQDSVVAIICDLSLGDGDGKDLLDLVRTSEKSKKIPFLVLSSSVDVEEKLDALNRGADIFLSKSEDPRLVSAYLSRLISKY